MVTVSTKTAKGRALLSRAICYKGEDLYDVYGRFSARKLQAYHDCEEMCKAEGGEDFRICSRSSHQFSVSWKVADGWRMETAYNSYHIVVED